MHHGVIASGAKQSSAIGLTALTAHSGPNGRTPPRCLVFYVARNSSCCLSQAFMRIRCAAALCSAPAVTHPYIRPGVAGNRFRNSVWLVDTKKNNVDALTVAQHGEAVDDDHPEHRATTVRLTIRFPPRRLCTEVVLGKGSHVIITRNLWQRKGLGDYSDGENFTYSLVFTGIVNNHWHRGRHHLGMWNRELRSTPRRFGILQGLQRPDTMAN
jgi:hypothetical protein